MSRNKINTILLVVFSIVAVSFTSAQSLQDNPDYRTSVKLKIASEAAFEEGDYEESRKLANESVVYSKKSDEWIAMMLSKYRANSALKKVNRRLYIVNRIQASTNFPEELKKGTALYDEANELYKNEKYIESYPLAIEALEVLKVIIYISPKGVLPAAYVVLNKPGNEDCLWKIAGYDYIYGEGAEWKLIYEANKSILPNPSNPDLIVPGLILQIPSINGEKRSGTWKDGAIQ